RLFAMDCRVKPGNDHGALLLPQPAGLPLHPMTATLPFWFSLAIKMAVTASFVVAASFIAQRSGPLIGAMVATLPISAGPVYVFLALDYDAAFIAQSAVASIVINGI